MQSPLSFLIWTAPSDNSLASFSYLRASAFICGSPFSVRPQSVAWWSKSKRSILFMFLKRVLHYLDPRSLFGKIDPNSSLRFMHGINRISIFLFLFCLVVMLVRAFTR